MEFHEVYFPIELKLNFEQENESKSMHNKNKQLKVASGSMYFRLFNIHHGFPQAK